MAIRSQFVRISIHAPRTGSDGVLLAHETQEEAISIHAPRTGSDVMVAIQMLCGLFQSTLPARGAT